MDRLIVKGFPSDISSSRFQNKIQLNQINFREYRSLVLADFEKVWKPGVNLCTLTQIYFSHCLVVTVVRWFCHEHWRLVTSILIHSFLQISADGSQGCPLYFLSSNQKEGPKKQFDLVEKIIVSIMITYCLHKNIQIITVMQLMLLMTSILARFPRGDCLAYQCINVF